MGSTEIMGGLVMSDKGKYFVSVHADHQKIGDGNAVHPREFVERRMWKELLDKVGHKDILELPPDPTIQTPCGNSTLFLSLYVMTPQELDKVIRQEIAEYLLARVAKDNPTIFRQKAMKGGLS